MLRRDYPVFYEFVLDTICHRLCSPAWSKFGQTYTLAETRNF
jgi:hypothetical protein